MTIRSPTAPGMLERALAAREALAHQVFDVGQVLAAIEAAAGEGRTWLRLRQSQKVSLDGTKAGRRLLKRLSELGYATRWEWVMSLPGEDLEQKWCELVISWGG